jgi:hypothetical protein
MYQLKNIIRLLKEEIIFYLSQKNTYINFKFIFFRKYLFSYFYFHSKYKLITLTAT